MTLHPDAAKKAQEEIDAVVGEGHLPTLSDRRSLPYIDCIIKEVFRYVVNSTVQAKDLLN